LQSDFWEQLKDKGLVVIGLNTGEDGDPEAAARGFQQQHGLTYPIVLDKSGEVADALGVEGFPTNIVIDREGKVRQVIAGFDETALNNALRELGVG